MTGNMDIILWTYSKTKTIMKRGVTGNLAIILWTHIVRLYNEDGYDW